MEEEFAMGMTPICDRPGHNRQRSGFSLLELVIVIAIVAILAGVAIPRYAQANQRYRAEMAAKKVVADLDYARRRASTSSSAQSIDFDAANEQYQLPGVDDLRTGSGDYTIDLSASPYNTKIVSADFNGDGEVIFDGYGLPDSGGTIVVGVGDYTKTVVLNADSGRAEIQ
jgi:prepilin-type N-terminal cleavage/methylation domain-containing protein